VGARAEDAREVKFLTGSGRLRIEIAGRPMATYVYRDEAIPRPYFADVRAPNGARVTRNHPPIEGQDPTDHATFHPGIWLAFGDLSGADDWRIQARVEHAGFVEEPKGRAGRGAFAVRNRYLSTRGDATICEEVCRYTIVVRPSGYLLIADSEFSSDKGDFAFGDQEEMGLGIRVATPLTVKQGGRILDSQGRKDERQVWGKAADWCDYSGAIAGQQVGVTLMPDPSNFRRSWYHARDYGLLVANPFGRHAFQEGAESRVVVKRGGRFPLRFGLLLHASPATEPVDLKAAYRDYLEQRDRPRP
jgi:hypothetical protein